LLDKMKGLLMDHCRRVGIIGQPHKAPIEGKVSDDTRRQLEALGYFD